MVKLLINRHNNKYSYTHTSDDNLLKNIELFDKLSLRFSGRILFIKDVIGSSEICCWSYYGNGRRVAEVCCMYKFCFEEGRSLKRIFIYQAHPLFMQLLKSTQKLNFLKLEFMKRLYKCCSMKIVISPIKNCCKQQHLCVELELAFQHTLVMKKKDR